MQHSMLGIIAAAGRGSRMNSEIPKPLTLLPNGKTMLELQIEKMEKFVDKLVVVTNEIVMSHKSFKLNDKVEYRIQDSPTGMGDAVFCAAESINNAKNIAVLWVDQIGITEETMRLCIDAQRNSAGTQITLPVILKDNSYIELKFIDGILKEVRQNREGDFIEKPSLSDSGFFCLSGGKLLLDSWSLGGKQYSLGRKSGEYNFLPFLAYLSANNWNVVTLNARNSDSYGVNNYAELRDYLEKGNL